MVIFTVTYVFTFLRRINNKKKHVELCKYNDFCKIELAEEDKNIKQYRPGAKSLKMNSVIYADFESILLPYSSCDKEDVITKSLNKQVPCGYSISVVTNHKTKIIIMCQNRLISEVKAQLLHFVKKYLDIAEDLLNIQKEDELRYCKTLSYLQKSIR